ncbi:MAG: hypothetical protein IPM57_05755 [Oligoflexia bacterium]|nr:hypothetical protein [Oligoflexia bacterium]
MNLVEEKIILSKEGLTNKTDGVLNIQLLSQKERLVRALKFGGMCWGAAIFSVFLPILHFFLVPGLLLAGPVVVFIVYKQTKLILSGSGECSSCKESLNIQKSFYRFPLSIVCNKCNNSITCMKY